MAIEMGPEEEIAHGEAFQRFIKNIEGKSKCKRLDSEDGKVTKIETEDGESFNIERLEDSRDSRVKGSHRLLEKTFGEDEVDTLDTIRTAMEGKVVGDEETPDPKLIVTTVENEKNEVVGTTHSAILESFDEDFSGKGKGFALDAYTAVEKGAQNKGVGLELFRHRIRQLEKEAKEQGRPLEAVVSEVHGEAEKFYNDTGFKRLYYETAEGKIKELPYFQAVLADSWNKKTGTPKKGEGPVPEHLMIAQLDGRERIEVEEVMEKIRALMDYNSFQTEGYFKNDEAFNKHEEILSKYLEDLEKELSQAKEIKLMSAEDRDVLQMSGIEFIEHTVADEER